jgi:hypothetical protein
MSQIVPPQVVVVIAGDIEIDDLIGPPFAQALDRPDGIPQVLVVLESLALHQPSVFEEENRDKTILLHRISRKF